MNGTHNRDSIRTSAKNLARFGSWHADSPEPRHQIRVTMAKRDQFTIVLTCPYCGVAGAAVWEENGLINVKGPQRRLISIQGEFHKESGRTESGDPIIVCNRCDEIQPD